MILGTLRRELAVLPQKSRLLHHAVGSTLVNTFQPRAAALTASKAFSTSGMTELQRQLTDKSLNRRYCKFLEMRNVINKGSSPDSDLYYLFMNKINYFYYDFLLKC